MKPLKSFLLVLCTIATLSATAQSKSKNVTPVREVNIEGRYSMMIPQYLEAGNDLNDEASLQYQNINKEVYIIVIDEPKQDFIDVFLELNDYDTTKSVLQNYARAQMESIRENMSKVSKESPLRKLNTQTGTALGYDVAGFQEGIEDEMGFTVAFIEGRLNLYMIMTWTFEKDKKKYQVDMDNMIISFKELSGDIAAPKFTYSPAGIWVPEYMTATDKYPDALLCYESVFHGLTAAVYSESIHSWDSLYARKATGNQSLLDFFTVSQQEEAKTHLKDVRLMTEPQKSRINGLDAQTFTLYGQPGNSDTAMYYQFCCIQGKNALYIIQLWASPDKRALDEPIMKEIINSFIEY